MGRHIELTAASLDAAFTTLVAGPALDVATLPEPRSPCDRVVEGMNPPTPAPKAKPGLGRTKGFNIGGDSSTLRVALRADEMVDRLLAMSPRGSLHTVFGYLEQWADAGGVTLPLLLAPALLIPYPDRSGWKLTMTAAPGLNPVLVHRLSTIALPGFDAQQSWQAYSTSVEASLAEAPGWRVRPRFGLGRIDTTTRDALDKLLDRPVLASLLAPPAQKPVGPPPGPDAVANVLPLAIDITEQARVVLETVEAGRNAVVEADPGSDTVGLGAGLVAAGLAKGRSILCVAPAPAIARLGRRLAALGLDPFCLTLTADSDTAGFLRHLEQRLASRPTRVDEAEAAGNDGLRRARERLRAYAERLASRPGRLERTLFELIWRAAAAERRLGRRPVGIETLIETPEIRDATWHAKALRALEDGAFGADRDLWSWLGAVGRTADRTALHRHLAAWHEALRAQTAAEAALAKRFGDPLPKDVAGLIAAAAELPPDLVRVILQADSPAELLTGMEAVAAGLAPLRANLAPWLLRTDQLGRQQAALRAIEDVLAEAPQMWPSNLEAADLAAGAVAGDRLVEGLHRLERLIRPMLGPPASAVGVLHFLVALPEIDPSAFDVRFLDANARRLLKRMIEAAEALTATETGLEQRFKLDALPSIIEVERHRQALAAGGVFAAFKPSVKAARAAHAGFLRRAPPQRPGLAEVEVDLRGLVSYLQARADFASNARYRALLGAAFKGHRGDLRPFDRAARLAERATSMLDNDAASALLRLPAAVIEDLRAALDDASTQNALRALPDGVEPAAALDEAEATRLRLWRLHAAVAALGLRPETTSAALPGLRVAFATYFETATIRYGSKPFGVDPDGLDPGRVTALRRLLADPALEAALPALRTALAEADPALSAYLAATRASAGAETELAATGWLDAKALHALATRRGGRIAALERALAEPVSSSSETPAALGLDRLLAFAEGEAVTDRNALLDLALCRTLARRHATDDPATAGLDGTTLDAARARFARLDARARTLGRAALAAGLAARPPATKAVSDLEGTPTTPLIDTMAADGCAVLALCPGLLATPEAVARHLPGDFAVDLVVVDGTGNMPPEGVLAALGRGRQAVLVDTAPAARDGADVPADDARADLFTLVRAAFGSPLRFSFPDPSLDPGSQALAQAALGVEVSAFFPSPRPSGVRRHAVPGRYDPDAATNPIEARALAARVVACLRAAIGREHRSICVLAFNRRQAELIRRTIAAVVAQEPAVSTGLDFAGGRTAVRVIDLDVDRGGRYDLVLVSTTYGPTLFEDQDLGSLDRPGGLDRLGGLIARAGRVELFTSLDQRLDRAIDPTQTGAAPSDARAALRAPARRGGRAGDEASRSGRSARQRSRALRRRRPGRPRLQPLRPARRRDRPSGARRRPSRPARPLSVRCSHRRARRRCCRRA